MRLTDKVTKTLLILAMITMAILVSACMEKDLSRENDADKLVTNTGNISNVTWEWTGTIEVDAKTPLVVPDSKKYTIKFMEDGTYYIVADCNTGSGTYVLDNGNMTLNPGPMTLMACGEGSVTNKYLAYLGNVDSVVLEGEQLKLYLKDSDDRMLFSLQY
ncbi:META domain-containing protein [Methanolobus sediminis]|uniref:META domain-containing protein n=1 Tax=Methanolobus sediminis TaxID=3072978 RepID=A0AA51UK79_9EURY|nr:META domain-containing protein [Methanolobus sediminis]WMW25103.1 META domain-containing protein [Methanolobus sediminis]